MPISFSLKTMCSPPQKKKPPAPRPQLSLRACCRINGGEFFFFKGEAMFMNNLFSWAEIFFPSKSNLRWEKLPDNEAFPFSNRGKPLSKSKSAYVHVMNDTGVSTDRVNQHNRSELSK